MKNLGIMVDCSRDACYTPDAVEKFTEIIAKMGYNVLMLYTEDMYSLEGEPYFGYMRGRYTNEEWKRMDAYAKSRGVELVPCIQTLAHLSAVTRWQTYGETCVDGNDILLVDQPETYALIEKMFAWASECFTSRRIHIGMDEAYTVGLGRYLDLHGYRPRFEILQNHLRRIGEIAARYGFTCLLWSDMFVKTANGGNYYPDKFEMSPEIVNAVPPEMQLVYWDYDHTEQSHYEKMLDGHSVFRNEIWFSGAVWSNLGFTPHNAFAEKSSKKGIEGCRKKGIENVLITSWKDDGAESSLFSVLPALAFVAACARGEGTREKAAEIFEKAVGESYKDYLIADLPDFADGDPELCNPVKYGLYNDPFLGLLDYHVNENRAAFFADAAKKLHEQAKKSKFGYLFDTLSKACAVMEYKYDLGIRTRRAYRNRDTVELRLLAEKIYPETARRVEVLYNAFRTQWEKECKHNGFEVHDIRLGGLMRRIIHCGELLSDFVAGKIDRIDPLEEDVLPFVKGKKQGEGLLYSIWTNTAMTKPWN